MTRCPPGSPSSGLVNQMLPIVSRDRVSIVIVPAGTPAATAICAAAVASARGGGGSYMPYAPDITIRCARPERYSAAARRARATVAGRGRCRVRVPEHADAFGNPTSDKRQPTVELLMWISQTPGSLPLTLFDLLDPAILTWIPGPVPVLRLRVLDHVRVALRV